MFLIFSSKVPYFCWNPRANNRISLSRLAYLRIIPFIFPRYIWVDPYYRWDSWIWPFRHSAWILSIFVVCRWIFSSWFRKHVQLDCGWNFWSHWFPFAARSGGCSFSPFRKSSSEFPFLSGVLRCPCSSMPHRHKAACRLAKVNRITLGNHAHVPV